METQAPTKIKVQSKSEMRRLAIQTGKAEEEFELPVRACSIDNPECESCQ